MGSAKTEGVVKLKLRSTDAVVIGGVMVCASALDTGAVELVIQAPKATGIIRYDRRLHRAPQIGKPIPDDVAREVAAKGERMGRPCST